MRQVVLFLSIVLMVLTSCASITPAVKGQDVFKAEETPALEAEKEIALPPSTALDREDLSKILSAAVADIEKKGCTALFLDERAAAIWCRCTNSKGKIVMKIYELDALIKGYSAWKEEQESERGAKGKAQGEK